MPENEKSRIDEQVVMTSDEAAAVDIPAVKKTAPVRKPVQAEESAKPAAKKKVQSAGAASKTGASARKPSGTAAKTAARKTNTDAEVRVARKQVNKKPMSAKARKRRKRLIKKLIRRFFLCLFSVLAVAVFGVYMICDTVFHGPSQTASDLLVNTVLETSALKWVPLLYFSQEEVDEIVARNAIEVPNEPTDTSLVVINREEKKEDAAVEEKDIELVEVSGATYHGYMMIVKDPSRVVLGVSSEDFESDYGKFIDQIAIDSGAVAAINAGGFEDEGGSGKGGKPLGVTIKDSKVVSKSTSAACNIVIGFDQDDKLIVGELTAKQAIAAGIRDAASFGPILVLNGEPAAVRGSSSGLNPRTAIGQRADGAVLMLVIDGRQVNSLGASLADLVDVMMQFGAVNAANLDGGSSSKMWYEGEFINDGVALTGSRRIPTAFIVK